MTNIVFILIVALIIDAAIGDPDWLWRRLPHPVVLFGWLIERAEKIGNKANFSPFWRRFNGFFALIILLLIAGLVGWGLDWLLSQGGAVGLMIEAVIASLFLAQRSLSQHVKAVYLAYQNEGQEHFPKTGNRFSGKNCSKNKQLEKMAEARAKTKNALEQFLKSGNRFSDKNCGKNKELEHLVEPSETKNALESARRAVGLIVGRDPDNLDEAGICRAAIESLSENSSDGVIAPAFWFLLAGLPGIMVYKMLNTADSMIGHKNARYGDFGFCAARLDDVANLLPARLTALLVAIAALGLWGRPQAKTAIIVSVRDAKKHRSPNAGWPESAYAGALGISLAGPRSYGAQKVAAPFQNEAGRAPIPADILQALNLFWGSMVAFLAFLLVFLLIELFLI